MAEYHSPAVVQPSLPVADVALRERMFQEIVRRSSTIDAIEDTAAFTCSKMRPSGFGGSVMLIPTDAIQVLP